jgi:hypothetical protein
VEGLESNFLLIVLLKNKYHLHNINEGEIYLTQYLWVRNIGGSSEISIHLEVYGDMEMNIPNINILC